mmetsp:Transcript_28857/g.95979  ORF Transcript_28857/g.95979 Transcript_28857/m.95979 type:complete len:459 (+) Transcript_28857:2516-3892(+)
MHDHLLDESRDVHRVPREQGSLGIDQGVGVHDVGDEVQQSPGAIVHELRRVVHLLQLIVQKDVVREPDDAVQRRAKLVGHRGSELRFLQLELPQAGDVLTYADHAHDCTVLVHARCGAQQEDPRLVTGGGDEHLHGGRIIALHGLLEHGLGLLTVALIHVPKEGASEGLVLRHSCHLDEALVPIRHLPLLIDTHDRCARGVDDPLQLTRHAEGLAGLPLQLGDVLADEDDADDSVVGVEAWGGVEEQLAVLAALREQDEVEAVDDLSTERALQHFMCLFVSFLGYEGLQEREADRFVCCVTADTRYQPVPDSDPARGVDTDDGGIGRVHDPCEVVGNALALLHQSPKPTDILADTKDSDDLPIECRRWRGIQQDLNLRAVLRQQRKLKIGCLSALTSKLEHLLDLLSVFRCGELRNQVTAQGLLLGKTGKRHSLHVPLSDATLGVDCEDRSICCLNEA